MTLLWFACVILIGLFGVTFYRLLDVQEERRALEHTVAELEHKIYAEKMSPEKFSMIDKVTKLTKENSDLMLENARLSAKINTITLKKYKNRKWDGAK